ncbi:MAG TPA: helicase-associated domain-containing protein [Spirochaetota bacterium]|nr:helicase-associated domain-containing protein [Spirochaetota bacterium]HOD13580.1 helicase-associated domain-containing protein [Spirochaetota bacterium]HPG49724.1 helicase-associated domain-containing protein [Spirochaetota bacterium]HPN10432.1 helicase-associated domain-containing protein [Spirochaetota bacterium]HQL80808.1 helicase-associated domain-containing protein [Spirochaetota bacterium]
MKEISETIKKLTPEDFKELAGRLQLKNKSKKDLIGALTSITGMHTLLKTLDTNCHRVLKVVYGAPEGASFVEIQKELKLEIPSIEKTAETLSRCLLLYITKNRQMLNSKMDKAYGIAELAPFLHIVEPKAITDRLHKNYLHLEMQKQTQPADKALKDHDMRTVLKFLAGSGCVATLDAVRDRLPQKSSEKILAGMISQNLVSLHQCYRPEFNTYLVLQDKLSPAAAALDEADDPRKKIKVSNRYFLLHNLLHTFDVISTFGLFLTKQQDFRKIDIRRISEVMLPLKDQGGVDIPLEESAQLSMFLLNRLGCLKLNKDIAGISLLGIRNELEQPLLLVKRILKSAAPGACDPFFTPPFETPAYELCKSIIKLLHKLKSAGHAYFQITMLTRSLSEADERAFGDGLIDLEDKIERFATALNFLCIAGIVDIDNGRLSLSDIGRDLANNMLKAYPVEEASAPGKNIYINPDFTLVIPAQELPSETLYHLLTHTDITKHDIIINAVISKAAIVRAQKRGMTLNRFLDALASYSRNELPQNLNFLLREWSNQTITLTISQSILLTTNHHEFIDELMLGIAKEGIIERISQTHALIKKEYIDEIIKIARKKDAVISLFSELEEED